MNEDEKWMRQAIKEAINAENEGEVPVGAVLVKDGRLISKAHNQSISKNDASAHAEIQLIRSAGEIQKNYRLTGCLLYVTLEPCAMCLGAIMHARIKRIIYGANDTKTGVCGSCIDLTNGDNFNHRVQITSGVLAEDCKKMIQNFFRNKRH